MTTKRKGTGRITSKKNGLTLRQQAEAVLRHNADSNYTTTSALPEDMLSLLHELRVHQIELEMQNEELRQSQVNLEAARDRYISLYDFAPVGYLILRRSGIIQEANLTATQMLGVPRSQLIGSALAHFVFPEDQDIYYHSLKALFRSERRGTFEVRLVKNEGKPFNARLEATMKDGEEVIQIIISDISDIRQAEQSLKELNATLEQRVSQRTAELLESEQRYFAIFDKSPVGIALTKMPEAVTVSANNAFLELLEYTREDVIGTKNAGLGIPDPATRARVEVELGERGAVHNFEFTRTMKSGDNLILSLNLDWVNIGGDKHILTTIRNITERRRVENALQGTRQILQTVVDRIPAAVALIRGSDLRLQLVNPAYQAVAPGKEMPGHTLDEIWTETGQDFAAICRHVLETGEPYQRVDELNMIRRVPDGPLEQAYFTWSLDRVQLPGDQGWGLLNTSYETTARKQAEDELYKAYEEMEQRVRERTSELVTLNEELKAEIAERERAEKKAQTNALLAEGLAQSVIALNSNLDLDYVLDTILEQLRHSIPFTIAAITQIKGDSMRVMRYSSLDSHPEAAKALEINHLVINYPLQKKVIATLQPVYIEDISKCPDWVYVTGLDWMRSYIAAPLVVGGQIKGTIHLLSDQTGMFSQETISHLMTFAAPAAMAFQNAGLYAAELKSRREAEAISAMSLELTRTLDLDAFLRTVLKFLPSLITYDGAWIVIVENETHLKLRALDGFDDDGSMRTIGSLIKTEEIPYIQEVLTTRKSLLIQDTRYYPGWEPLVARKEVRSWLGVPILLRGEVMGVVGIVHPEPGIFTREDLRIGELMAAHVSVAIQNTWLFKQVQAGQERFQMLSRRLVETLENERRYIARELHDETSQAVTGILFLLRKIEQEADNPERVLTNVTEVKQLTDEVLESMHRLAMNLRPASLDHVGLIPALEQLIKDFAQHYRKNISFKSETGLEAKRLSDYIETALYRIVQEALTNSVRHARAQNIDVILESRDEKILVVIEDDGIGFDTNGIQESHKLGLVGMQERAKMMGGELQIESRPDGGTTIVVSVGIDITAM